MKNHKDSSDEEEEEEAIVSPFDNKFDESIEVRNAQEIKSPVNRRRISESSGKSHKRSVDGSSSTIDVNSPRPKHGHARTSQDSTDFGKTPSRVSSETSESEETDDDDIQGSNLEKPIQIYDPKKFQDLEVSQETQELFYNIMRYTPQKIELNYKLIPFLPDYIPAVGDVDAFLKIPRPDEVDDEIGLTVLDEPCIDQSDPVVLHMQLRSKCRSAGATRQTVMKRIEDAEKNGKQIDKWIEDMNELHRSKHPPAVKLSKTIPDLDTLMQFWPVEVQEKLNEAQIDLTILDCDLTVLVDVVCNVFDIPVDDDTRLEALHTLFILFLEIRNATTVDQQF